MLKRGGKRLQEERRGCSCGILLLFRGECSGESCSGGIQSSAERGISRRANGLVLLRRYSKYAEHLRKPFFFALAVFYSHRAPRGCSAQREILLLEEIQG
jgi:hypothetical protein